jgi:hypothetical protein
LFGVECFVTLFDEVLEQPVVDGLGHGAEGVTALGDVHSLCDELRSDLDPGLADVLVELFSFDSEQLCDADSGLETVRLSLLLTTLLLELHGTHVHAGGRHSVNVVTLVTREVQDLKRFLMTGYEGVNGEFIN